MGLIKQEIFVCVDCETTGLDTAEDHIIEVAAAEFTFDKIIDTFETLVDPGKAIPQESIAIHHITDDMVKNKPTIGQVLPDLLNFIDKHIIVGHGIPFDIEMLINAAKRSSIECSLQDNKVIDTLRLARLYGESPMNSLEYLRQHFNIEEEGAHRAMSDVIVNIEVFKRLIKDFSTTNQLFKRLERPIRLKTMPLGKHKGRPFKEIPLEYLKWAANKQFDQDLLFSIRTEIKLRKKGNHFSQATNPFHSL